MPANDPLVGRGALSEHVIRTPDFDGLSSTLVTQVFALGRVLVVASGDCIAFSSIPIQDFFGLFKKGPVTCDP
jgi:hypothetical protein